MWKRYDPQRRFTHERRDEVLKPEILYVFNGHLSVYDIRKVWPQLHRKDVSVVRCTVARLMRDLDLLGVIRRKPKHTTISDRSAPCPLDKVNRQLKAEEMHRRGPWRSFEAVGYATLEWMDWFDNRRILEPTGNITPAEAEQQFYAALDHIPIAA